jgi:replication-associated recombination protein RarA
MVEKAGRPRVRFAELTTPGGYKVGEVVSALQKDLRRGNEREALFWATELSLAGYTNYVWKRLRIIASEDVGPGDPMCCVIVRTLYENWKEQKQADKGSEYNANLFLIHGVITIARATKSRVCDTAYVVMLGDRQLIDIPDYALDMHTRRGRSMGRGIEHFYKEAAIVHPAAEFDDPYLTEAIAVDEHEDQMKRRSPRSDPTAGAPDE